MTLNWRRKITKILVLLPQGKSKNMQWYQGYAADYGWHLRAQHIVANYEKSGHPLFQGVSPLGRGKLKKTNNRDTIHFNVEHGNIDLLYRTDCSCREPALYLQGSLKVVRTEFRRSKPKETWKCSQDVSRNSNKTGWSQAIGWYSKTIACIGKPNAPEFEGFQFDAIYEQNWTSPCNGEILPSDRERKQLCCNFSWWWRMEKAHFDVQRIHSAKKPRGFKATRINWCRKCKFFQFKHLTDCT